MLSHSLAPDLLPVVHFNYVLIGCRVMQTRSSTRVAPATFPYRFGRLRRSPPALSARAHVLIDSWHLAGGRVRPEGSRQQLNSHTEWRVRATRSPGWE